MMRDFEVTMAARVLTLCILMTSAGVLIGEHHLLTFLFRKQDPAAIVVQDQLDEMRERLDGLEAELRVQAKRIPNGAGGSPMIFYDEGITPPMPSCSTVQVIPLDGAIPIDTSKVTYSAPIDCVEHEDPR